MNRNEFIKNIMSLYPYTFDLNNTQQCAGWKKCYEQKPESWDFDKLMVIFSKKWNSTREAPSPSWFMQFREDVKPVKVYKQERIEMTPEQQEKTDKMMKEFKTKLYEIVQKQ